MSSIQFWLSFNNGEERLQLPVNPSSIQVASPFGYDDINVSNLGEYTVIGERLLKDFSIASFFPRDYNEVYCEYAAIPDPWDALHTLERWRDSRQPIRLTITGTPINEAVTIRDLSYDAERAGSPGDIYFTLSLKKFKFTNVRKATKEPQKTKVQSQSPRTNLRTKSKTYTVKSGDTLYKIAAKVFGDGNKWRELYEENKSVIGNNPNLIKPGQKLVIPNV